MPEDVRAASAALCAPGETTDPKMRCTPPADRVAGHAGKLRHGGFAALRPEWMARHAFQDVPVLPLLRFRRARAGICRGVDSDGALLLEADGRVERILSGEISLRPA
jgi:BirA family biotin operon repressor/biotin-[acetyl-CoA-carboxylase] ligase